METRKVQYTGSSTTISLPKEWADEHGVEAGMQLALYPAENGELIIGAEQTDDDEPPEFCVEGRSAMDIRQTVKALYAIGNDTFILTAEGEFDREQRRAVATVTTNLVGLEVRNESETELVLTTVFDAAAVSIERTVLQLQYTALSMHQDAIHGLIDGNEASAERVTNRRNDAERRFRVAESCFQRTLTDVEQLDRLGHSRPDIFDQYATARQLADVAEQAQRIATLVGSEATVEKPWPDEFERFARESRHLTEQAVDDVLSADEPPYETVRTCRELVDDVTELRRRLYRENEVTYVRSVAVGSLERTARGAVKIAERAVQASLRR
ncbi:Phosphate uptake regulator [Haladaptatus litoreus]|uniref:Phosphate uptake regulator n=1 Tax=Haladaptatus litoreus TaxID=553468 RepID=A0A1N6W9I3_9EURY|nr:AbrB/MazE/SpoVT family DNA-binding domain-containing protein [Haladaptatus litoreus]SIQ86744.1 Phosphate uptake regulator [Haladaptatus litoreus]